jgi:MoxR-like ATPase
LNKERLEIILNFWQDTLSENPKNENEDYDITDGSMWIESVEGVQKLVTDIDKIRKEDELRSKLRKLLVSKKYFLIWARKPYLLGSLLKICGFSELLELKKLVLEIRDSKDFSINWVDLVYDLIASVKPDSVAKYTAARAQITNVIGELFGKLHIKDKPIYNTCSEWALKHLGYNFEESYESFTDAFNNFKDFYLQCIGQQSSNVMPINLEIDQLFNFIDKNKEAKETVDKILSGQQLPSGKTAFSFNKKDFRSLTGKRKDADYLKGRFIELKEALIDAFDEQFDDFKDSIWLPRVTKASGKKGVPPIPRDNMWIGMAHQKQIQKFDANPRNAIQFQICIDILDPFSIEIWMEDKAKEARKIVKSNLVGKEKEFLALLKAMPEFRLFHSNLEHYYYFDEITLDDLEVFIDQLDDTGICAAIGKNYTQKEALDLGYNVVNEIIKTLKQLLPVYDAVAFGKFEEEIAVPPDSKSLDLGFPLIQTNLEIDSEVISQICANLTAGNNLIMTGPVGTGKTTLAEDVCKIAKDEDFCMGHILTTATSDWTTFDTIGGYMPRKDGELEFEEGKFLEAIRTNKWLIIDEINRADIDKAFGQLFTVLSGQKVELPFRDKKGRGISIDNTNDNRSYFDVDTATYKVGRNWRIIATMNVYDMNFLFEMSYAFMRRFSFIYLDIPKNFDELIDKWCEENELPETTPKKLQKLTDFSGRKMGPAIIKDVIRFIKIRGNGERAIAEAVVSYILPQLEGLEKPKIKEAWKDITDVFEDKDIPNMAVKPILEEIIGITLEEADE